MLSKAKPKFDAEVEDLLKDAMYQAFLEMLSSGNDDLIDEYVKKTTNKAAKKFANKVASIAAPRLTNAIDEYIKESGLFINVNPAGIQLVSPPTGGPVTGTIIINPTTSNIEIR